MYRILTSQIYEVFWEKALPDDIYIRFCFEKETFLLFLSVEGRDFSMVLFFNLLQFCFYSSLGNFSFF